MAVFSCSPAIFFPFPKKKRKWLFFPRFPFIITLHHGTVLDPLIRLRHNWRNNAQLPSKGPTLNKLIKLRREMAPADPPPNRPNDSVTARANCLSVPCLILIEAITAISCVSLSHSCMKKVGETLSHYLNSKEEEEEDEEETLALLSAISLLFLFLFCFIILMGAMGGYCEFSTCNSRPDPNPAQTQIYRR